MTQIARPERGIPREALAAAGVAATLAAALAWLGPPGSDFAAHLYQSGLFEDHGFGIWNNFWYAGPLQLRHLQPPLLPARGAARDQAARGREHRDGCARVRRRRVARVGAGVALVEPLVRRRLGGRRALRRVPVRARDRARTARALGAAGGAPGAVRAADGARADSEPGRVRAAGGDPGGDRPLARAAPGGARPAADDARARDRGRARAAAPLPRRRPLPVLAARVRGRVRVLRPRDRAHLARRGGRRAALDVRRLSRRLHGRLPRSVGPRREHRAAAVRGDPDRDPDALAAPLAPAAGCRSSRSRSRSPGTSPRSPAASSRRARTRPRTPPTGRRRSRSSATTSRPRTASRRSTPSGTGPPPTFPPPGIPIARGWFRQDDFPRNGLLYAKLDRARYLTWLRSLGVRYVVLPDAPLDYSAKAEGALIAGGVPASSPVFRSAHTTIYAVPSPRPIVTGPGQRRRARCSGRTGSPWLVARPGRYRIATNWSPYWTTGAGCLSRGDDGTVRLTTRRAGIVRLDLSVNAQGALVALEGGSKPRCAR